MGRRYRRAGPKGRRRGAASRATATASVTAKAAAACRRTRRFGARRRRSSRCNFGRRVEFASSGADPRGCGSSAAGRGEAADANASTQAPPCLKVACQPKGGGPTRGRARAKGEREGSRAGRTRTGAGSNGRTDLRTGTGNRVTRARAAHFGGRRVRDVGRG